MKVSIYYSHVSKFLLFKKVHSIELLDGDELIAGEIGYVVGGFTALSDVPASEGPP